MRSKATTRAQQRAIERARHLHNRAVEADEHRVLTDFVEAVENHVRLHPRGQR